MNVLNMFIDIQTSKELIQMGTYTMMTYMKHLQLMMKKLTQSELNLTELVHQTNIASVKPLSVFCKYQCSSYNNARIRMHDRI